MLASVKKQPITAYIFVFHGILFCFWISWTPIPTHICIWISIWVIPIFECRQNFKEHSIWKIDLHNLSICSYFTSWIPNKNSLSNYLQKTRLTIPINRVELVVILFRQGHQNINITCIYRSSPSIGANIYTILSIACYIPKLTVHCWCYSAISFWNKRTAVSWYYLSISLNIQTQCVHPPFTHFFSFSPEASCLISPA